MSSSSLISSSLHSHVTLKPEWCDEIKLSNLMLQRKSGTIKSLQLLSTSTLGGTLARLEGRLAQLARMQGLLMNKDTHRP